VLSPPQDEQTAMINVLHIVLGLHIGGLETFVLELIRKRSNVIQPYVVCLETLGSLGESVRNIPIFALDKAPGIQISCINKIRGITNKYKINIIHTHNEGAHFYGAVAGFLSGIPVIHTRHGIHDTANTKRVMLEWFSSLLSKKVVGVSRDIADLYIQKIRIPAYKVMTILNGVDSDLFSPRPTNRHKLLELDLPHETILIGIVARLALVKDHQTLFEACHILAKSHKCFRLVVIGDGPQRDGLIQLATRLGLNDTIIFTGARHDIADLLNCLDIFVLSSISEGISMTLLEAMACELPVVATDVGGNPEVVIDGETGCLVPSKNPPAFAEKLSLLMNDQVRRKHMGSAARNRVLMHFSIQNTVEQYEKCYGQILERNM